MAGFDTTLDKEIFAESVNFDNTAVKVSVMQYNEGVKKLQISRENFNAEGVGRFAKLGRLVKPEAEAILPLIQQALEHLD
jgi:hypothetical protein